MLNIMPFFKKKIYLFILERGKQRQRAHVSVSRWEGKKERERERSRTPIKCLRFQNS